MSVKTIPTKYEASDGKEFATKEEAERHDALETAMKTYKKARHDFSKALARTQKTADGVPFDFGLMHNYYYVTSGWSGRPDLNRVSFYQWTEFEFDDRDVFEIRVWEDRRDSKVQITYRINELYYDEREAKKALLVKQEEWLAGQTEQVAALRAELVKR